MRFFVLLVAATSLASSSMASPWRRGARTGGHKSCMTARDGQNIVNVYQRLIADYADADCEKYCADSFVDYSDSINVFLNQPLGGPTFASKKIFMAAQASNPPVPLVVDSVDAIECSVIALRWHATFGEANKPSNGMTVIKTTKEKGWWQIAELHVEFNSLIWLLDMGGNYTLPG